MDFDTWHHLAFLRPLIVFALACPLLILALLAGDFRARRDAKRAREAEAARNQKPTETPASGRYETARSARLTPREWRTSPPKSNPDRRVA